MLDALIGWAGLVVLVVAIVLALGTDVLRERTAQRQGSGRDGTAPRRLAGVLILAATALVVAVGLAVTVLRIASLA